MKILRSKITGFALLFLSCFIATFLIISQKKYTTINSENPPIDSFIILSAKFSFFTSENEFLFLEQERVGSGVIIHSTSDHSYVLTAAHLCVWADVSDMDMSSIAQDDAMVTFEHSLLTGHNKRAQGRILAIDLDHDLCILESDNYLGPAVLISTHKPKYYEKIHNLASPQGLARPFIVPFFDGYYLGEDFDSYYFSLPIAGGSSGSPVFNSRFELIAMLHSKPHHFSNYAIAAKSEDILKILDEAYSHLEIETKQKQIDD